MHFKEIEGVKLAWQGLQGHVLHGKPLVINFDKLEELVSIIGELGLDLFLVSTNIILMELEAEHFAKVLVLIEDEEDKLVIPLGVWNGTIERDGFYLVGRLLSSKSYRIEYLRSTIASIISPLKGMDITELGGGRLLFKFYHALDRNMLMEGCLWTFERHLLIPRPVEHVIPK
ncbi:UNVERIFIED_CONTAM: hypothetical protein Sradi_5288900 [Sesamum radiatum]|uniref:DUF4283 domain-containing protein n=1 Tax=Sesamum radiatum TaxID=300843 RepID=A0AAW2LP45_SESRA